MATVQSRLDNWATAELRGADQVNTNVLLSWYNKGLQIFQKKILEYVSGKQNTSVVFLDIEAGKDEYPLPIFDAEEHVEDFYSIIQLRVAYKTSDKYGTAPKYSRYNSSETYYNYIRKDYVEETNPEYADLLTKGYYIKNGNSYVVVRANSQYSSSTTYYSKVGFDTYEVVTNPEHALLLTKSYYILEEQGYPLYTVCKPMEFGDYNINPMINFPETGELKKQGGRQIGGPYVWGRISMINPRYIFVPKVDNNGNYSNSIKIFPTPLRDIPRGLTLTYNFIQQPITNPNTDESKLNLPRYFLDAIDDYLTFRLYQAENPELAATYYQQFEKTLEDNIYGLNKDKRPIDEGFADLRYFYHH